MKTDFPRTLPASHQLLVALRSAIVFLAVCGLGYTGLATLLGGLFFPDQAIGSLILHEGRNRIVRRLLEAVGHPVIELARIQFGPVRLGNTKAGKMRKLTAREISELYDAVGL